MVDVSECWAGMTRESEDEKGTGREREGRCECITYLSTIPHALLTLLRLTSVMRSVAFEQRTG